VCPRRSEAQRRQRREAAAAQPRFAHSLRGPPRRLHFWRVPVVGPGGRPNLRLARRLLSPSGMKTTTLALSMAVIGIAATAAVARADDAPNTPPPPAAPPPVVASHAEDQPRTLFSTPIKSGGYGAPVVSYTRFAGSDAVLVGGRGGWLINHQFVIGGGGYGVANRVRTPEGAAPNDSDYQINFGYGGLWLEYLVAPMQVVHGSIGTLIGAGGLTYHRFRPEGMAGDMESNAVFVLDPAVGVEVNVTSFMRFSVQTGYRVVRGVTLASLDNQDASGFTLGTLVKFGKF
jgi:hypothetical protein